MATAPEEEGVRLQEVAPGGKSREDVVNVMERRGQMRRWWHAGGGAGDAEMAVGDRLAGAGAGFWEPTTCIVQ